MRKVRFIDLCAGLGGFHHGATLAAGADGKTRFECVLASEADDELRELYASNFRKDLEPTYKALYQAHAEDGESAHASCFEGKRLARVHGRIEELLGDPSSKGSKPAGCLVPEHDLLCAGFPCQPFSKSGAQLGFDDTENGRGTVFGMIAEILELRQPSYVLLENVGNFERHDGGRTWEHVRQVLGRHYHVAATQHVMSSGDEGPGLLSPHLLGLPHHRERFFICAQHKKKVGPFATTPPFPLTHQSVQANGPRAQLRQARETEATKQLTRIVSKGSQRASEEELERARLSDDQEQCIDHWQKLLDELDLLQGDQLRLPSFPIWGFELDPWHHYPFEPAGVAPIEHGKQAISDYRRTQVQRAKGLGLEPPASGMNEATFSGRGKGPQRWIMGWPAYACERDRWPAWKVRFIRQNRDWAWQIVALLTEANRLPWYRKWLDKLHELTPSFQKLEWNCKGEKPQLRENILQFRPSGLRVKRFRHVPALVAMTTTQVPVVPNLSKKNKTKEEAAVRRQSRFLLPSEAKQLQGFPADWQVPATHSRTFKALGNAVHAEVVSLILRKWILGHDVDADVRKANAGPTQLLLPKFATNPTHQ